MPSLSATPAMRSGLDAQVVFLTDLTHRTYDAMRKLSELNLQFAQQAMQDAADTSRNILGCTDVFQVGAAVAKAAQPATERLRNYQQQLLGILSGAQLDFSRSAASLAPEPSRYASAMADSMARGSGAPAGGNGAHHTPG